MILQIDIIKNIDFRTQGAEYGVTIGLGFYLGTYFWHLLELSPVGTGLLTGGIRFLANIITIPIFGLGRERL